MKRNQTWKACKKYSGGENVFCCHRLAFFPDFHLVVSHSITEYHRTESGADTVSQLPPFSASVVFLAVASTLDSTRVYRWHYVHRRLNTPRICLTGCDIQLFSPSGVFENPVTSNTNHTCRVLINAPPSVKIRIQALHIGLVFNATNSQSTYIMVNTSFWTHVVVSICYILNRKKNQCDNTCSVLVLVCFLFRSGIWMS